MDVMDPTMLSQPVSPGTGAPLGFGKFFKMFIAFMIASAIGGEMLHDGDFSQARTAPAAIMRGCVEAFRAAPFTFSLNRDVPVPAERLENASGNKAVKQLRREGFTLGDATLLYAGKLFYNDRVLYGSKSVSQVLPAFFYKDTCRVKVFLKNNRVTGVFARAVRQSALPQFPFYPLPNS